jgi:hypothetical protein
VGSRERKRAERRKRKARSPADRSVTPPEGAGGDEGAGAAAADIGAAAQADPDPEAAGTAMERGYARAEERNREAREALVPLREGERPRVVTIGAVLSALLVVSMWAGYLAGVEVDGERPSIVQVAAPSLLIGVMAWGMWRARYWAVLGFQTLLLFLLMGASWGLATRAASVGQIAATTLMLAVAGTLFYFMIKALARIQMPHRLPRE